jgi:two-component system, OmpR family, phosphate regulon sensor histidine kinase PhoR
LPDSEPTVVHRAIIAGGVGNIEHMSEKEDGRPGGAAEVQGQPLLLEAVIDDIPVGLVVVDRKGQVVKANVEALRILGRDSIDAPELTGWRETEAYHPDGRRVRPDEWPMARTLSAGTIVDGERFELVTGSGRPVVEINSAPIAGEAGEPIGGLAVFRDVTAREAVERAERDFITNAAHELQSPLAVIISAVEVLQSGAKEGPERDVFLDHIDRASHRLARVMRSLLVLARAQSGIELPREEIVALEPLLDQVAGDLRPAQGVEVRVSCPPGAALVTNRELLEQAIVNLAENAAKHTTTGSIALTVRASDTAMEITVADSGPGIPAHERPRVFERFYRGAGHHKVGSGLGLAVVRAAADSIGAEIGLDSSPGAGTVVRLRLPRPANLMPA